MKSTGCFHGIIRTRGFHYSRKLLQRKDLGSLVQQSKIIQLEIDGLESLLESPVFKQQHKWNGSKKILSKESIDQSISFNLRQNPFAKMLSSPARQDRSSRALSYPRDLMMRFSLTKDSEGNLWTAPNIHQIYTNGESTYVPHSKEWIASRAKRPMDFAPLEVLASVNKITDPKNMKFNPTNDLVIDREYMIYLIEELDTQISSSHKNQAKTNDLIIYLKEREENTKITLEHDGGVDYNGEIIQVDQQGIIHALLYKLDIERPEPPIVDHYEQLLTKLMEKSRDDQVILSPESHSKLIEMFLKFIFYNYK